MLVDIRTELAVLLPDLSVRGISIKIERGIVIDAAIGLDHNWGSECGEPGGERRVQARVIDSAWAG